MKYRRFLIFFGVTFALVLAGLASWDMISHEFFKIKDKVREEARGLKNPNICKKFQPGCDLDDLIQNMGNPTSRHEDIYYFASGFMGGVIHAQVNPASKKVLMLQCGEEGGPAEWQISE